MRRIDRAITDAEQLTSILRRGKYATVAMCHNAEPYLVTLSYGYDVERNALYFHMATAGRKQEAILEDPHVCASIVIDGGYQEGECRHVYESVVLTGRMAMVEDHDEARYGMKVLLGHLEGDPDAVWERQALDAEETWRRLRVARLDIEEMTGKAGH
jgi:uncharacterized protein